MLWDRTGEHHLFSIFKNIFLGGGDANVEKISKNKLNSVALEVSVKNDEDKFHVKAPQKYSGMCICGCRSRKLTSVREGAININLYPGCPARLARKQNEKLRKAYQKEKKLKASWKQRDELQQPGKSAAEANFRNLKTFEGRKCSKCGSKIKNKYGFCLECTTVDKKLRDAMRRGAYPEDLTPSERKKILEIYEKCKRISEETGIPHHVDHIKPLARGGRHHPDNLQVITASENLKKGAKWTG